MTLKEVKETLQTWISTADDEYDREEQGRVLGLKEALHEINKVDDWTLVSERLPIDVDKYYLVTCKAPNINEDVLKAAKTIKEYCKSIQNDCKGCVFYKRGALDGCKLHNPYRLPEEWEIEKEGKQDG